MVSVGPAEWAVILVLAMMLLAPGLMAKKKHQTSALLKMFLFGALLSEAYVLANEALQSRLAPWDRISLVEHASLAFRGGLTAVILFFFLRAQIWRLSKTTFLMFLAATWYVQRMLNIGLYLFTEAMRGSMPEGVVNFYSDIGHWLVPHFTYPYFLLDSISAALLIWATYFVTYRPFFSTKSAAVSSWAAYGGSNMSTDETTRLLCASAFLSGQSFREQVLEHVKDKNRAFAPEIGLDVPLVAQVCQFAENRQRRYTWLFLLVALLSFVIGLATGPTAAVVTGVLLSAGLYLKKSAQERSLVRRYYQRGSFNPSEVKERFLAQLELGSLNGLVEAQRNLVVYQGFTPFVGAGIDLGGWSFTVDIKKPAESDLLHSQRGQPIPFETEELYTVIDQEVRSLNLERLTIDDYWFVNGAEIRNDQRILPDAYSRPRNKLDETVANELKRVSDPKIRHYQWIRVHDWGNDLVLSYFFRCTLRGSSLFVEINRFLLTPVFWTYRAADRIAEQGFAEHVNEFLKAFLVGPLQTVAACFQVLGFLTEGMEHIFDTKERKRRQEIRSNPLFNYGASVSLRYKFSSDSFSHYFQKLDGDFYTKVLEHQILDGIVDFLEDHNIDTSEIRERRTTILNSGVIVQGGDVKAESLAVGAGSVATKSSSTPRKQKPQNAEGAAA